MIAGLFIRFSAAFLNPETSELYAGWRTSELIAVWRFLNSTQFGNFRTHRSLETSELIAVLRLPCSSPSGDFNTFPYGYKREKKQEKVQNHSEARGKYGTGQEKMDIRPRKTVKKSKIIRKPEGNTEPGRRKWT